MILLTINNLSQRLVESLCVYLLLVIGAPGVLAAQEPAEEDTPPRPTVQEMKKAIIGKNIFKPAYIPPPPASPETAEATIWDPGPSRLNRPFKVMAFDETNETGPQAYLLFDNPSEMRPVKVGDVIETIKILEINPPYIRCNYGSTEVRIDIGETSDDALAHLRGFGRDYELVGTTVLPDIAFAHILVQNRLYRVEVGDQLGDAEIIDIQPGKVKLRYDDGFEIEIPTTPTKP